VLVEVCASPDEQFVRYTRGVTQPPILLGTSSFTASGWAGSFYPKWMRPAGRTPTSLDPSSTSPPRKVKPRSQPQPFSQGSVGSSNSSEILARIVQAVAVLVVNLRPTRREVFVHVNFRAINPRSRIERPLSVPICVPVMPRTLSKSFRDTKHSRTVPSRRSRKITAVPRRSLNLFGPFKGLRTCP